MRAMEARNEDRRRWIRGALIIGSREVAALMGAPSTFLVFALFQLMGGVFFASLLYQGDRLGLPMLFRNLAILLLLLLPVATVRFIVAERKGGTLELLLSSGAGHWEIVLGKFVALALWTGLLCLLSLQYPLVMSLFAAIDWPVVTCAFLGLLGLAWALVALALAAATWTRTWLASASLAFFAGLGFWSIRGLASVFTDRPLPLLVGLSVVPRLDRMTAGLLTSGDLLFFFSMIFFFLFLAVRGLDWERGGGRA